MFSHTSKCLIILTLICLITGCSTVPSIEAWRPWMRTSNGLQRIRIGSKIKIEVKGETQPLLGSEEFNRQAISSELVTLLERRGYRIVKDAEEYKLSVTYRVQRHDRLALSSSTSSESSTATVTSSRSRSGATSGLGVGIANAVAALVTSTQTTAEQRAESIEAYSHVISLEIHDKIELLTWKGEAEWDDPSIGMIPRYLATLQLLLSGLPYDTSIRPRVAEVKKSHALNYYKLECEKTSFSCPALPYRITFEDLSDGSAATSLPGSINDPQALVAYVDLIRTAEYALPLGESKYDNPLLISLWSDVELGGQYLVGADQRPVNVLVRMTGESSGYFITECKVANEKEFQIFRDKLAKWKLALQSYNDFYQ